MNSAVAKEQLNQCVSELRGVLAERQGALAMLMEGARAQRTAALNAQLSEKQSLLENAGLLTYTQELLKEPDQSCFVQAARVTHNRLDCMFVCVCCWDYVNLFIYEIRNPQWPILCFHWTTFNKVHKHWYIMLHIVNWFTERFYYIHLSFTWFLSLFSSGW